MSIQDNDKFNYSNNYNNYNNLGNNYNNNNLSNVGKQLICIYFLFNIKTQIIMKVIRI